MILTEIPGMLSLTVILAVGLSATLAALSLRLSPKTRPFATGLTFLALMGTGWALAISAMVLDPPRWSHSAGMLVLTLPTAWLAGWNLTKAWRARAG
jgi:hydrogenase/urease accessory protein HupE